MEIHENIALRERNWFRTGGPAEYYCEPQNSADFSRALTFALEKNFPLFFLGEGANILVSDAGFPGLVVHPNNTDIKILSEDRDEVLIRAGSGVSMQTLIDYCLERNCIGLEDFSGIPGTVGGAVYINLHYFEYLLADFFDRGTVIDKKTGEIEEKDLDWFRFGYDESRLHDDEHYLIDATFRLRRVSETESAYARGRRDEIIRHRDRRYPDSNTCGSFFRNFHPGEVTLTIDGEPMLYVAYYLDKLGVKGALQVGGARISSKHANMLVTNEVAKSEDVIKLARTMQRMVNEEYGIVPQPECQLVGFDSYPLMQTEGE
ncbi:MAG: UDP-N-acetylmuramate dehydrogenase [Candidatus Marinimicrobia bacterium]|nr:UDP-N-acetylmuramate dehydrogenase [Candidatus Neomarinimicrobiota bacterium]MCF7828613.1 UDP-N-acetylmuramate dehydrogenase [Candidatus Neomarinimicrobiota bacterium]MCF7880354.1 UDP-N-acetylmuramate dehydrogenase [Candidatus Neomarinimicrobiota bacterium]